MGEEGGDYLTWDQGKYHPKDCGLRWDGTGYRNAEEINGTKTWKRAQEPRSSSV